ncbi:hypothetical protein IEO21_04447 [Rhodonia placenta]|uniref:RING-CH-type domain-containing protein n=1 Tax=Rhodonia placenta TaxID=104341 RepID=A0A8H7P465_9APHY|nr:hypothetical protein IEO21_04447 [Postia placenta]
MYSEHHVPTVDDLRVKLCFICREEERYDNPDDPPRVWTHPCSCTLVAHESCLLQWIQAAQQDPSKAGNALKCPQCGTRYELESHNPFVLRLLDNVNKSISIVGKFVSVAGIVGIGVSFGFGVYVVCTAYGSYAVKVFLGKEMYDLLLTDDLSNWPWHAFVNLPFIPLSLILSRTRFFTSLPLIPLFLPWASTPPVASTQSMMAARWNPLVRKAPVYPSAPLFGWPPSPIVITIAYSILTSFYRRGYSTLKHWILGTPSNAQHTIREVIWDLGGHARIGVNINDGEHPANQDQQAAQGEQAPANGDAGQEQAGDNDPGVVAERTLRVTNASLGRFIGGALMMPTIANCMGAILLRLSRHSRLLQRFLAVRPPMRGGVPPTLASWLEAQPWGEMSYMRQVATGLKVALDLVCGGTRTWEECDPVWWRNSIGLGIYIVAKDCIQLLHLYLAKRELETRRIKNRSFEGIDVKELDLIDRSLRS